jgi:glycosyltransferase involved in cell wall biosynthesis
VRIWIVGDNFGFPNGTGSTARVHGFAQALRKTGAEVRVFCLTPTQSGTHGSLDSAPQGVHDGVPFEYACGTTALPRGLFARRWLRVRSTGRMLDAARRARRAGAAPDVVLATSQTLSGLAVELATSRLARARCVLDACELASGFVPAGPRRLLHRWLYACLARRLAGVLCISTALERYWSAHAPRVPSLRVPILTDVGRAGGPCEGGERGARVLYAGNLSHAEELTTLLHAFAAIAEDFPDACLQVLGDDPDADTRGRLRAAAGALDIASRIELPGAVDRAGVARALGAAAVLVLPRPRTDWSEAGLSAKLAEYLASGRPVVVTAIGDVPLYLEDRVSAFVVAPGDPAAFAAGLREALGDPQRARAVGARGREVALAAFDTAVQGPRMRRFFEALG